MTLLMIVMMKMKVLEIVREEKAKEKREKETKKRNTERMMMDLLPNKEGKLCRRLLFLPARAQTLTPERRNRKSEYLRLVFSCLVREKHRLRLS